jgi:hypothetical protein
VDYHRIIIPIIPTTTLDDARRVNVVSTLDPFAKDESVAWVSRLDAIIFVDK